MSNENWLSELLDDIATLSQNSHLKIDHSKFKAVYSSINHEVLNKNELMTKLQTLNEVTGWLQATSEVKTLDNEMIVADSPLLNGEWVVGSNSDDIQTSYVLEYIGDNKWVLQRCILDFTHNKVANSLAERVMHKQVGVKNTRYLVYQKLWTHNDRTVNADMAFFVGFDI